MTSYMLLDHDSMAGSRLVRGACAPWTEKWAHGVREIGLRGEDGAERRMPAPAAESEGFQREG